MSNTQILQLSPSEIQEEVGFNLRNYDAANVSQHIEDLTQAFLNGNFIPPILVRKSQNGYFLIDGHCRWHAAKNAIEKGAPENLKLSAVLFKGSDRERLEVMLRSSDNLKFTPVETAKGYLRLQRMGLNLTEISRSVNKAINSVSRFLLLATAPVAIQKMVDDEKVSFDVAVDAIQEHGEKALEFLEKNRLLLNIKGLSEKKMTAGDVRAWLPKRRVLESMTQVLGEHEDIFNNDYEEEAKTENEGVVIPLHVYSQLKSLFQTIKKEKSKKERREQKLIDKYQKENELQDSNILEDDALDNDETSNDENLAESEEEQTEVFTTN